MQTGSLRGFAYSQRLSIAVSDLLCVMPLAFQSNSEKTQTSAFVSAQKNHCQKRTVMHVVLCEGFALASHNCVHFLRLSFWKKKLLGLIKVALLEIATGNTHRGWFLERKKTNETDVDKSLTTSEQTRSLGEVFVRAGAKERDLVEGSGL